MAIKKDMDFNGLKAPGAYARIGSFGFTRTPQGNLLRAQIDVFASEEIARSEGGKPFFQHVSQVEAPDRDQNPFVLLYEELKKNPLFEGGEDC